MAASAFDGDDAGQPAEERGLMEREKDKRLGRGGTRISADVKPPAARFLSHLAVHAKKYSFGRGAMSRQAAVEKNPD
jgi:hypothetical protein